MLAVAYVLRLEDLRREVDALNMATSVAAALGSGGTYLDWSTVKAEFDDDLAAEAAVPADQPVTTSGIKLRALGLE